MDSVPTEPGGLGSQRVGFCATPAGDTDAVLKIIKEQSILGSLAEQDLLALVRQTPVRALPKNRVLFRNGDEGRSVFLTLLG